MAGLFTSITNSGEALSAYEQALSITQNNVNNANTAGFAKQGASFLANAFDPQGGLSGGVTAGPATDSRDPYADAAVREQVSSLNLSQQSATSLGEIQSYFPIDGTSGISAALNSLYSSFSAWSVDPNGSAARSSVISSATTLAQQFQQTATNLAKTSAGADQKIHSTVDAINALGAQIAQYNVERSKSSQADPNLEANLTANLENLSQYANVSALRQADGTVTVLLGGQAPLVVGSQQYKLSVSSSSDPSAPNPNAPPSTTILGSDGSNITGDITQGTLGGLLNVRNQVIPSLIGDGSHTGQLNDLAKSIADRVNQLLTQGNISDGPPAQPGVALFKYNQNAPTGVAASLAVDPSVTASQLAAIAPGPPYVANGTAQALANLPTDSAAQVNGQSYSTFFAQIASSIGSQVAGATNGTNTGKQLVAQTQALRDAGSAVSLDAEAANLIEFQKAYQANSQLVSVLDNLTLATINMVITTG
jgi:flagellar hook-associated protein 1 FlgK